MLKLVVLLTILHCGLQEELTSRKITWKPPEWELSDNLLHKPSVQEYLNKWNSTIPESQDLPDKIFQFSANDSRMILTDFTNCLTVYNFMDCFKMFLLTRVKGVVSDLEKSNTTGLDFELLNGIITLKWRNESANEQFDVSPTMDLSKKLNVYVMRLFKSRSLQVQILPGLGLELTPKSVPDENGLVCFTAKTFKADNSENDSGAEMRKKGDKRKKKKGGGFNMMPMMIVPQMIMLGMLPFALANLKMMVMNAFMMNSMALNGAIAMTIRNMVFGPKKGPKIKYVNYGYNKPKISKKPELVLHSPAAFVERPHPGYVRRTEPKKQLRLRSKVKPTPVPDDSSLPYNKPSQSDGYNGQPYSDVDAPISYLNNNQYLQPSVSTYQEENSETPVNYDGYQAFENINLQNEEGQGGEFEYKQTYSSEYKEPPANYYPNHRLYR